MTDTSRPRVCVDALGGDFAPDEILSGVSEALVSDPSLDVVLTGPVDVVEPFAASHAPRVEAVPTTQAIGMDEHPAQAIRTKPDSSMVVGCRLVKEGRASAFFSAGSTGASMAAATLVMGRIQGVTRPAIATVIPTRGHPLVLLDAGANADCRPDNLLAFAHMGAAYAEVVLGIAAPTIALLNIGSEPSKGSQLALEAHELLAARLQGFAGNLEANHLMDGDIDVLVTDGFTGNIVLKLLEGTSKTILAQVREALTSSRVSSLGALASKSALTRLRERLDPDEYGGAPLLGVRGVCIIGHGSSKAKAVRAALGVAARAVRGGLTDAIAAHLAGDQAPVADGATQD
jgi:glycerol-3-phosphate acyltransferase PlsX